MKEATEFGTAPGREPGRIAPAFDPQYLDDASPLPSLALDRQFDRVSGISL
jgi:hypothetical protein